MPIYNYLDLSTAHITPQDSDKLDRIAPELLLPLIVCKHPYGFWIHVPVGHEWEETIKAIETRLLVLEFSPAIREILYCANKWNCFWVNLDQDGDEEPLLEVYDWDLLTNENSELEKRT